MNLRLLIGTRNRSSWSLRPWLALKRSGLAFEEVLIPLGAPDWKERVADVSPTGKVPALRHDDLSVWDSLAICEYVAELAPEAKLWPVDRKARAEARSICAEMHAGFPNVRDQLSMDMTARKSPGELRPGTLAEIERIVSIWTSLTARHASSGPFLFGRFTIADAFYAPVVSRFVTYGIEVPAEARRYMDAVLAMPEMKAWMEDARREVVHS